MWPRLFFFSYAVFQVTVPTYLLFTNYLDGGRRFGWQMFARSPIDQNVIVHLAERQQTVNLNDLLFSYRSDFPPNNNIARAVCSRIVGSKAVVFHSASQGEVKFPCP